jgi:hypothetical protein
MKTIPLSKGQFAIVDDGLFSELNKFEWYAWRPAKTFYAVRRVIRNGRRGLCLMHREVFRLRGERVPKTVDHKNRNGLDNRRRNLRPATRGQQNMNHSRRPNNKSGYIGVSWYKQLKKWMAYCNVNGKRKHIGYFDDAEDAARARDKYAKKRHRGFAVLNFAA